jgi:N-acetyl-gamma-glutamyl-phosphate reductase
LPVRRGITAGIYARLAKGKGSDDLETSFAKSYQDYPLVKFGAAEKNPGLLQLKKVVGTGETHISYVADGEKLYLFSCIDNLLKGASSQAIENLNRISDLPLSLGVGHLEALT